MHAKTRLYVGNAATNNGTVSNDPKYLGSTTTPIGSTIDDADAYPREDYIKVFAGNGATNNKIVSPDFNYRNDGTESIGFLSLKPILGGKEVLVGRGPNTNGTATTSNQFQGEPTEFVGYTMPYP